MTRSEDPVDGALTAKEKLAAKRREQEHTMWETWQTDPTPDNIRPLMQHFEPVFKQKVRMWKAPNVNEPAFRADLKSQAIEAFKTYDPTRGASLRTHLENRLKKSMRYNIQQQNYARIPEHKAVHIGRINMATDALTEELGRTPTPDEVADYLNPRMSKRQQLTGKKVQQIQQAQIGDVMGSAFESDPVPRAATAGREVWGLLRSSLKPEEQTVYDHLNAANSELTKKLGRPPTDKELKAHVSTSRLAKLMGTNPSQISRLRTSILKKYKRYSGE